MTYFPNMSDFGKALVTLLATMEKQREEAKKELSAVLLRELNARIRKELDQLSREGAVKIGRTINDTYIKINGNEQVG